MSVDFFIGVAIGVVGGIFIGLAMARKLWTILIWVSVGTSFGQYPAADVRAAYADAMTLPVESRSQARYLSLSFVPAAIRSDLVVACNYAVNALSRVRQIKQCTPVGKYLLRIDVSNYVNDATETEAWELAWAAMAVNEPYFHLQTQVAYAGRIQTVAVAGGWTDLGRESSLRQSTGTPQAGAILRADYFVATALAPPAYYAFAGVPATEGEWLKSNGVDAAAIARLGADLWANLNISDPTKKPRRVVWDQGALGSVFKTLDSKVADAVHNPFYRPITADGSTVLYDAGEYFLMGPNGFWKVAVFDSSGKRLDFVDPKIASDYVGAADGAADTQIYSGMNCFRCHQTSGLNSFTNNQFELYQTNKGRVELSSYSSSYVRRVLEFYDDGRLQRQIRFDRESHELAVQRACETTPAKSVGCLAAVVKGYSYDAVRPETLAVELNVPLGCLTSVIDGTTDPNLAAILEAKPISRGAWESAYHEAALKAAAYHRSHP
jgi:hypothetical protein